MKSHNITETSEPYDSINYENIGGVGHENI